MIVIVNNVRYYIVVIYYNVRRLLIMCYCESGQLGIVYLLDVIVFCSEGYKLRLILFYLF